MSTKKIWLGVPGVSKGYSIICVAFPEVGETVQGETGPELVTKHNVDDFKFPAAIITMPESWIASPPGVAKYVPIRAIFRNVKGEAWIEGTLSDYQRYSQFHWKNQDDGLWYRYAQVSQTAYREWKNHVK